MTTSHLTRRGALGAAAGLAAAAPMLGSAVLNTASAAAPMLGPTRPSVYRFPLGKFEVTTIHDGAIALDGPHPIFGENQTAETVQEYAAANNLPPTRMEIGFTPVIVNTARYVTGQAEYDFWSKPDMAENRVGKLVQSNVVPLADKMSFLGDEGSVAGGITSVAAFGHTPGHMAFHIESEGKRLLLFADVCNHYIVSLQKPDWHVRFDMDKEGGIPATGYHMPFPAVGFVQPMSGGGFRWSAVSYQLHV